MVIDAKCVTFATLRFYELTYTPMKLSLCAIIMRSYCFAILLLL